MRLVRLLPWLGTAVIQRRRSPFDTYPLEVAQADRHEREALLAALRHEFGTEIDARALARIERVFQQQETDE